ncbi:MAG: hypothetical protein AVDCRST_MAG68-3514, partial [uncultured Gemmatimonadetes bacterium]
GLPGVHRRRGHFVAGVGHVSRLRGQRAPGVRERVAGLRVRVGAAPAGARAGRLGDGHRRPAPRHAGRRPAQPPRAPGPRRARAGAGTRAVGPPGRRRAREAGPTLQPRPGARPQRAARRGPHPARL